MLILGGAGLLAVIITVMIINPAPSDFYAWLLEVIVKPIISIVMIGIGIFMMVNAIWKTSASAEQRGAIYSRANQLELLNEIRNLRGDLPNVPSKTNSPQKGQRLTYRIIPSKITLWGMATAGILCVAFVTVGAILVVTAVVKLQMGRSDWLVAGSLVIPISVAAMWSFYRFIRQFLKATSIGPSTIELAHYPIVPGHKNQVFLSQAGTMRLKFIDVHLVCYEEATFNQGTTSMTKRQPVYASRLLRKRGIEVSSDQPYETEFEFQVPVGAMHSFQSLSNRITWQIEIHGKTKGYPAVVRSFEIIVIPIIEKQHRQITGRQQSR